MTFSTRFKALGRGSPKSQGREVILLAYANHGQSALRRFGDRVAGWQSIDGIFVDPDMPRTKGIKSERGRLVLRSFRAPHIYCLSHDWSGILEIRRSSEVFEIDLFSLKAHVVKIDTGTGRVSRATSLELQAILNLSLIKGAPESGAVSVTVDVLPPEKPIILARVSVDGDRGDLDLANIAATDEQNNWRLLQAGPDSQPVLVGRAGSIDLDLPRTAELTFVRAPEAGLARIRAGTSTLELDLSGPPDSEIVVTLADLRAGWTAPAFTVPEPAYDSYDRMIGRLDPDQPIALYTPRWKGVAASTRSLFDQCIPFPPGDAHPDQVTPADVRRYADILLELGARRFVISGADLYWLDIVSHVRQANPEVRFDLLWHSNYVQMGELHDWLLFSHWLKAYQEGVIRRIGVVKSGYERLLAGLGIDAVFIPNVVRVDPNTIVTTTVTDTVGLWLSGSTDYRKAPHAALLAMAECAPLRIKASGVQVDARRMINELGIPVRRVWSSPLPPDLLYREMRSTAATLYVTISECSPMLPLESLGLGVPCLIGPSSHLFRDHARLREYLTVSQPLSPGAIAEKLKDVIRQREDVISLYRDYAREEIQFSKRAVEEFLM